MKYTKPFITDKEIREARRLHEGDTETWNKEKGYLTNDQYRSCVNMAELTGLPIEVVYRIVKPNMNPQPCAYITKELAILALQF